MSLNQVGILFNFLAGFLLAPDIFGEEKLLKWDHDLKKLLFRLAGKVRNFNFQSSSDSKSDYFFNVLVGGIVSIVIFYFLSFPLRAFYQLLSEAESLSGLTQSLQAKIDHYNPDDLLPFIGYFILMILFFSLLTIRDLILYFKTRKKMYTPILIVTLFLLSVGLLGMFSPPMLILLWMVVALVFFGLIGVIFLCASLVALAGLSVQLLILSLANQRGLRGAITAIGVISFIVGNILQFLAG